MMHLSEAPGNVKIGEEGELGSETGQWFKTFSLIELTMDMSESKDGMNFFEEIRFLRSVKLQAMAHR